jgi:hypothetical protein
MANRLVRIIVDATMLTRACGENRRLNIGYDKLLQTCMAYAQNARPSGQ